MRLGRGRAHLTRSHGLVARWVRQLIRASHLPGGARSCGHGTNTRPSGKRWEGVQPASWWWFLARTARDGWQRTKPVPPPACCIADVAGCGLSSAAFLAVVPALPLPKGYAWPSARLRKSGAWGHDGCFVSGRCPSLHDNKPACPLPRIRRREDAFASVSPPSIPNRPSSLVLRPLPNCCPALPSRIVTYIDTTYRHIAGCLTYPLAPTHFPRAPVLQYQPTAPCTVQ